MKKLPKIYQNSIRKTINNNKTVCYLKNENTPYQTNNIEDTLDAIFNGMGYAYNIPVTLTTKYKTYNTSLITKTKNNVVTLDNDIIPLVDIIDIKINK